MKHINYKSDFDFIFGIVDPQGRDVGFPAFDWEARFYTGSRLNSVTVSCVGGVCTNCYNDDGRIHVVINKPNIGVGRLQVELHTMVEDSIFADGVRDTYFPMPLDIELVSGMGDAPTAAEIEAAVNALAYLKGDKGDQGERGEKGEKGDKGDAFTYADFTADEIAELQRPATVAATVAAQETLKCKGETIAARNAAAEATEAAQSANAAAVAATEAAAGIEAAKYAAFDELWQSIGGTVIGGGRFRMGAGGKELTRQEAALRYGRNGFIELWNCECTFIDYYDRKRPKGCYNEGTGYFELNGLTNLTYENALDIVKLGRPPFAAGGFSNGNGGGARTNLPWNTAQKNMEGGTFSSMNSLEVAEIGEDYPYQTITDSDVFSICYSLRKILGVMEVTASCVPFRQCDKLEDVKLRVKRLGATVHIDPPSLSYGSYRYMVDNSSGCTIMVKAATYAKLTGDMEDATVAAMTDDERQQWMQIAEDAAAKGITFALWG